MTLTPSSYVVSKLSKPSGDSNEAIFHQQNLMSVMSSGKNPPEAKRQLSLMINHFITANALPFHLSECPLLNKMLVLAKTNNLYKPPRRDEMSGSLLDANYTAYQTSSLVKLLNNAGILGLGIYSDRATIGKFQ